MTSFFLPSSSILSLSLLLYHFISCHCNSIQFNSIQFFRLATEVLKVVDEELASRPFIYAQGKYVHASHPFSVMFVILNNLIVIFIVYLIHSFSAIRTFQPVNLCNSSYISFAILISNFVYGFVS